MILADRVETLGVGLRTRVKRLGAKEKSEKEKVQGEVLAHLEEQRLSEKLHEDRCEKAVEIGVGFRESVERKCSGYCAHIMVKLEETDGSSCSQNQVCFRDRCSSELTLFWNWNWY